MVLRTKIVSIAVGSVMVTATVGLWIQRSVIRAEGVDLIRDTMRVTILGAENTRQSISAMRSARMFDEPKLKAEASTAADFRKTGLYKTVPVVAAWNSIADVAAKEGYEFRVPAHSPRNPDNAPRADEEAILAKLEGGADEFFVVDEKANKVVYARPITLGSDCLACHGEPSTSPTGNGKDMLGYRMEGWRAGDRHGAFLLRAKLDRVDAVVRAGVVKAALWIVPLSVLIGFGVFWLLTRISDNLRVVIDSISDSSAQLSAAVAQISNANQSVAQGVSEQAAAVQETSSAGEQVTSMIRKNAEASREAAAEMHEVTQRIDNGNSSLNKMVTSMDEIKASSERISRIIKVIDDIAFQTNILALNAAVESARAGEAGAGFAVVADEVRSLAQRSAQAARDTAPLIEESITRAQDGHNCLVEVTAMVQGITDSAAKVRTLIDQVSGGSQEQTHGMEQISRALHEIDTVTQHSVAHSEENAAASEQLAAQAGSLNEVAQQLKRIVEG